MKKINLFFKLLKEGLNWNSMDEKPKEYGKYYMFKSKYGKEYFALWKDEDTVKIGNNEYGLSNFVGWKI